MAIRRTSVAVLSVLLAGGAMAACSTTPTAVFKPSNRHKHHSSSTTSTTTTSTTASATTTTTSTTTTSTTNATTAVASTCQNSQLTVTATRGGGAAGTIEQPFTIANTGKSPCVLDGYPTITLVPKSGTVNPQVSHSGQGQVFQASPRAITLPANGSDSAAFVMSYTDVQVNGQTSCPEMVAIKAALPGPAGTFQFAERLYPCGAPNIAVSAIVDYATYKSQFG
jgi:cytoskeletal protein RodZ